MDPRRRPEARPDTGRLGPMGLYDAQTGMPLCYEGRNVRSKTR
jgi:hypothetical protein